MISDDIFATSFGPHPIAPTRMHLVVSAMLWDPRSLVAALGVTELMFHRSSTIADMHSAIYWDGQRQALRAIRYGVEIGRITAPRRARRRRDTKPETPVESHRSKGATC